MRRDVLGVALGLVLACAAAFPAHAATVDTWSFDEANGSDSIVSSGGLVGTLQRTGSTFGVQVVDGGLEFDGHGRVLVSDAPNPNELGFSVSVSLVTSTVPNSHVGDFDLVRKGLAGDKRYWKVELFPNAAHTEAYAFCKMRGWHADTASYTQAGLKWKAKNLSDGTSHTIVCTKTDTKVTLAVDGVVRVTRNVSVGTVYNSKPLSMGAKPNVWQDMYEGRLDEVSYAIG